MNKILLDLLSPVRPAPLPGLSDDGLQSMWEECGKHNVRQLFYNQLISLFKNDNSPGEVARFCRQQRMFSLQSAAYSIKQQALQNHILAFLKLNDIPAVVLKGTAIAADIYGNINTRVSIDIDLLLRDTDTDRVNTLFLEYGFTRRDTMPLSFLRYRLHHTTYVSTDEHHKSPIEVHWNFSIPGFFNLTSNDIWQEISADTQGEYHLSPKMNLIMLLMHHHRHAFGELRNLLDLFWAIFKHQDDIDWQEFAKMIERIGLVKVTLLSLRQISTLWPGQSRQLPVTMKLEEKLSTTRAARSLSLPLCNRIFAATHFENHTFAAREKLLYRVTLDHSGRILSSFLKTLFPSPAAINAFFPQQQTTALPVKYLRYLRWRLKAVSGDHN